MTDRFDNQGVLWPGDTATSRFERFVLIAVHLLLTGLIPAAVAGLIWLMWHDVSNQLVAVIDVEHLRQALQRGMAGILLVLLSLEFMHARLSLLGVSTLALTGGYSLMRRIASDRRRETAASIFSSHPEFSQEEIKR